MATEYFAVIAAKKWTERSDIMREILFRGKRTDNVEWVCGFASKTRQNWKRGAGTALKIVPDGEKFQTNELKLCIDYEDRGVMCSGVIVPETIGQYTGLTDKNGKRIFEGDIVKGLFLFEMEVNGVCIFKNGSFGLRWMRGNVEEFTPFTSTCNVEFEVIGNIHDQNLGDFDGKDTKTDSI